MSEETTLDIGCGRIPKGDVNIDLFVGKTHSPFHFINPKLIKNFVKGDAQHLPFRNNCFQIVYSSHVLEHLINPLQALKEFKRVSNMFVVIRVPHANFYRGIESKEHIFSWNSYTLRNLLKKLFRNVDVKTTWMENCFKTHKNRRLFALKLMLFAIFFGRNELTAICKKVRLK